MTSDLRVATAGALLARARRFLLEIADHDAPTGPDPKEARALVQRIDSYMRNTRAIVGTPVRPNVLIVRFENHDDKGPDATAGTLARFLTDVVPYLFPALTLAHVGDFSSDDARADALDFAGDVLNLIDAYPKVTYSVASLRDLAAQMRKDGFK